MKSIKISNGSRRRCAQKFPYKGIWKIINDAVRIIEEEGVQIAISEFVYDYSTEQRYNVMLFLLKDNATDADTIKELSEFDYIENPEGDAELEALLGLSKKQRITKLWRDGECHPPFIPKWLD